MSDYPDYDGFLENRNRNQSQPNGVSEDSSGDWGHRTDMEDVDHEYTRSVSERVNERQAGPEMSHSEVNEFLRDDDDGDNHGSEATHENGSDRLLVEE